MKVLLKVSDGCPALPVVTAVEKEKKQKKKQSEVLKKSMVQLKAKCPEYG